MNKAELMDKVLTIANESNAGRRLDKQEVDAVLNALAEVVSEALCKRDTVSLRGLGTFETKKCNSRPAHNPKTGKPMVIPARVVPVFKFSGPLKEDVKEACKV